MNADKLAILGGTPVIDKFDEPMFHWPIVNDAMRKASTAVLDEGVMSGTDRARRFEDGFAAWQGRKYALSFPSGTSAVTTALFALGIGPGDEVICPALTYWASCLGAQRALGATVVLVDCEPETMQIDPAAFEAAITPRTKAVVAVHLSACPCDMDRIMAIANRHHIAVMEDVSHAQGGHYKGTRCGNFGQVAAMSLMTGKSFAIGEGGMLVTDDYEIYRRAIRFGHYDRIVQHFTSEEIAETKNMPFGAMKNRLNQCAAAVGIEQLKKYDAERTEIDRAMLYFWKQLDGVPGVRVMWPRDAGSDKAGWYASRFHYDPSAFGGLSNVTFARAVSAETQGGFTPGCYMPLHFSSLFRKPGTLPVTERINQLIVSEPWFKHFVPEKIDRYAEAVRKVVAHWRELLPLDVGVKPCDGGLGLTDFEKKKRT